MRSITASCICNVDPVAGMNRDNLLFAGQLLPARNGGLAGTPGTRAQAPFAAAVFRGYGPENDAAAAAHRAASALLETGAALTAGSTLGELLFPLCAGTQTESGDPAGCSAAAAFLSEEGLSLASCGVCRAYLLRDRSLFLLTPAAGPEAPPYTISGVPAPGDRLLLCTGTLAETLSAQQLLELCAGAKSDGEALQQLLQKARDQGAKDSVTAVLLRFA